jgi:transposase
MTAPRVDQVLDPEALTVGALQFREDLERLDPRSRAVLTLTLAGYSQDEIVELLGETSIRAVEGVLYRWRKEEQNRRTRTHRGGDSRGRPR